MSKKVLKDMKKEDRNDFYISIPVILLMLGFIIFYSFSSVETEAPSFHSSLLENSQEISELTIAGSTFVPIQDLKYRKRISSPAKINKLPLKRLYSQSQSKVDTQSTHIIAADLVQEDEIQSTKEDTIIDSTIDYEQRIDSTQIGTDEIIVTETTAQAVEPETQNQNLDQECVIILGAFGRQSNVTRLLDRLSAEGYDSFSTPYKGLTRVGVYHNCNIESLMESLETIREKYTKDAMVLTKSEL